MKLLIAIPALNEEEAIASIIERSLAAREKIIQASPMDQVEITVVSDGSTDRTVEIAQSYGNKINLIVFEKNRGYGVAIKEAWSRSDADFLGFLDADGTCDPNFFTQLCSAAVKEDADVVLGCRMTRESRMPPLRRVGNTIFALLLSLFSSKRVRDTASGMRVVRRTSLPKLLPLPDGMHFTPAMSARAMLSQDLKLIEIDMPYHEREGRSKLRVIRDGLRFLRVIVEAAFLYRPSRPFVLTGLLFAATAAALMALPVVHYLQNGNILEWMVYRLVVSSLLVTSACLLLSSGYLAKKIVNIVISERPEAPHPTGALGRLFRGRFFWLAPLLLIGAGVALVAPSFAERLVTGSTHEHWSRYIAMSTLVGSGLTLIVTRVVDYTLDLIAARLVYFKSRDNGAERPALRLSA